MCRALGFRVPGRGAAPRVVGGCDGISSGSSRDIRCIRRNINSIRGRRRRRRRRRGDRIILRLRLRLRLTLALTLTLTLTLTMNGRDSVLRTNTDVLDEDVRTSVRGDGLEPCGDDREESE